MQTRVVIAASGSGVLSAIRRALAAAGFAVAAEAVDARSAFAAVVRERPDAVVFDSALPGGALVAAAAIASPGDPPPVLVLDEGGTDPRLRAAELAGASGYLRGPLDGDRLADAVVDLLRTTESHRREER